MPRLTRALVAVPLALALSAAPAAAPATADDRPDSIALPTGSMPEGIAAGPDGTFFAGARRDGAVYQADVATGALRTLVPPRSGEVAVGMDHDEATGRLWVAGGATGDVTAYDAEDGRVLLTANAGSGRFLNDVLVTPRAVYVTDSTRAEVLVVPLGPGGKLPRSPRLRTLRITGDYVQPQGFGLNGIDLLPTGDLLVVSGGVLYAVDPRTGRADRVEQGGRALTAGDGIELVGRTLYVVNGYRGDEVVLLRLDRAYESATVTGLLTDPSLDRPTTAAVVEGSLYVVNGRFSVASDPATTYSVSRLPLR